MRPVFLSAFIAALWAQTALAAPALQVAIADGRTIVKATTDKLAAWRAAKDVLIVAIPENSGEIEVGQLASGVQVERVSENGVNAVAVSGVESSWQVVQDGANWLVRPGKGAPGESVMLLKDGWYVGKDVVVPKTLTIAGKVWQVGMVGEARSVAGSVVGVAKAVKDAPVVASASPASSPASIQPADASSTADPLKAVSMNDMVARIEPSTTVEPHVAPALPESNPEPKLKKSMAEVAPSGLTKVPVFKAEPMKPMAVSSASSEILKEALGEIYLPGTFVSLTLPRTSSGLEHEDASSKKNLSEPVSVTHPVDPEPVSASSGTWNQATLAPVQHALDAQKIEAEEKKKALAEPSPTQVKEDFAENIPPREIAVEDIEPVDMFTGLLPNRGKFYNDDVSNALQSVAEAPDDSARARDARLRLAGVYMAWQRPEEALAVLNGLPERGDGLPATPQARLLMALAQLAKGDIPRAAALDQGGELSPHARLWRAVAASRAGDYATALKLWPQERGILPRYPAYLRSLAQLAQANALVMVGDRAVAQKVVDQLVDGYADPSQVPVGLVRLQGIVRLGTPDEAKGLEYLAAAAESMQDPAEAYRAKFEFVRALYQRRDLVEAQVRAYLTDLWFDWRGDDLEREVLGMLADLYDKANEPREALFYWQTLVKAFPRTPELGTITGRMTQAFLRVFDPENPKIYDTLAYLGMYYDFSELVPNDTRGDLVHEQVAKMLVDANLWERAVPILEQQLQYAKLDAPAQGRLSLLLAEAYGNMGRAADGIKIIDKWQHAATTTALQRQWKLLEADLLLKLRRPESVTRSLAKMPNNDVEVRDLRVEAAWQGGKWNESIPLLQAKLEGVTPAQLVSDTGAQLAAFRLGYAYGQTKNGEALDKLGQKYAAVLPQLPQLADGLGAVAAGTGVSASYVGTGPLAPVTTALSSINRLTDQVQGVRDSVTNQRKELQEYNDKMKYMELLPPPVLPR